MRAEEEARLAAHNARAETENARLDSEIERKHQECRDAVAPLEEQREVHAERINRAHKEAAQAVALAGGEYDSIAPSDASVLRTGQRDLKSIAASMGLPWVEQDHANQMGRVMGHIATAGFGTLFGISLGLITRFLHASALMRSPVVLLICIGLGALWAYLSRFFLYFTASHASECYYLDLGKRAWMPFALLTVASVLLTLTFDASVGRAGVLGLSACPRLDAARQPPGGGP